MSYFVDGFSLFIVGGTVTNLEHIEARGRVWGSHPKN